MSENGAPTIPSIYQPLNQEKKEIRLLRLVITDSGSVEGELQSFELANAPAYKTLSYAWGTDFTSQAILMNGSQSISISRNLHDFLQVFSRYGNRSWLWMFRKRPWIWIDQLCIAQDLIHEKNHQVGMMGEIYKRAEETIVWLGADPYHGAARALIRREIGACRNGELSGRSWSKDDSATLIALARLPYWSRQWIAQELALSKKRTLLYGDSELDWDDFEAIIGSVAIATEAFRALFKFVNSFDESRPKFADLDRTPYSRCYLLCTFVKDSQCQDPRDKVFGIQNTLPPALRVDVDYQASVWEVFLRTVKHWHAIFRESQGGEAYEDIFCSCCDWLAMGMGLLCPDRTINEQNQDPAFKQCVASLKENFIIPPEYTQGTENLLRFALTNVILPDDVWDWGQFPKAP